MCKCGKKIYKNGKCQDCQKIYIREYMRKKRASKILAAPKKEAEKMNVANVPVTVSGLAGVFPISDGGVKEYAISAEDRNTIRDPNPDWCHDRFPNINSSNKMMECHICGKLSLTHRKMCVKEGVNYAYNDCYAVK